MPPGGSIQRDVSRRRSDRLTVKPDDGVFGVVSVKRNSVALRLVRNVLVMKLKVLLRIIVLVDCRNRSWLVLLRARGYNRTHTDGGDTHRSKSRN